MKSKSAIFAAVAPEVAEWLDPTGSMRKSGLMRVTEKPAELFPGADLGFTLRADAQRAVPTFAELQAEREARRELDDQQMKLEIREA